MRPAEAVSEICPNASAAYLAALDAGDLLLVEHGLATSRRLGHFLAQALWRTDGMKIERETAVYTAAGLLAAFGAGAHSAAVAAGEAAALAGHPAETCERVWGLGNPAEAARLGNEAAGDGYLYRAGGLLQGRGRAHYRLWGARCGADLEGNPDLIAAAAHALAPAVLDWSRKKLNALADVDDIATISKVVEFGGHHWPRDAPGLVDRLAWYQRVEPLLGGRMF